MAIFSDKYSDFLPEKILTLDIFEQVYLRVEKINPDNYFIGIDFWLSDQVSNLDSSEPKSDVLPVTPSDSNSPLIFGNTNVELFFLKPQIIAKKVPV